MSVFGSVPVSVELQQPESSCSVAGAAPLQVGPSETAGLQPAERGLSWRLQELHHLYTILKYIVLKEGIEQFEHQGRNIDISVFKKCNFIWKRGSWNLLGADK